MPKVFNTVLEAAEKVHLADTQMFVLFSKTKPRGHRDATTGIYKVWTIREFKTFAMFFW